MKKKITILLLVLFATANIYSQNYNISFTASGATNTVISVKVLNLTQNISLTMNGADILHLGDVGINEFEVNRNNLKIYPNPMHGKAELMFYADKEGEVLVNIIDIRGLEILKYVRKAEKGIHKFQLNGLKQGMYFVNVRSETYSYSLKLISQNTNQSNLASISYLGFENPEKEIIKLKNTNAIVNMPYTDGDLLLFRGESGNYANIVTDVPTSNKTITFNFTACKDGDSNNYATVDIGNQIWMAENLKTSRYRNGTVIPNITNDTVWSVLSTGARCYYNNDSAMNSNTYGALYNWYTVNTYNICPTGWHVPSDAEWTTLITYLGGDSIAGGKLKASTLWNSPNAGATNSSGFTALPGGFYPGNGTYYNIGASTSWWSSTDYSAAHSWCRYISYYISNVERAGSNKTEGHSVRCLRDLGGQASLPSITITAIIAITPKYATLGGNVITDGGATVTSRGVCWSTTPNPTIVLITKTTDGSGIGSFTSNIAGLTPNTTYYVRAYATNSAGTAYGNEISLTTLPLSYFYPVYDIDSNGYDTVHIGTQIWMKQNLKTTRYNDGTPIAYPGNNNTAWQNNTTGAYAWLNNDEATYKNTFGALYNWFAVNTGNLCPTGWHVPSDAEWTTLTTYLGGESIAGGKLKATTIWNSPNASATNSSGFTALPGSIRYSDGISLNIYGNFGYWWSSTYYNSPSSWGRFMSYNDSTAGRSYFNKPSGFSVRCLSDLGAPISSITTTSTTAITVTTATSGGNITYDGGTTITARGVCWSTTPNPTVLNNKTIDGSGIGSFISNISGLVPNTIYYVRAYAANSVGTAYGNQISFTTLPNIYPVYDIDSNGYDTVHIGTQVWLKQNMKVGRYRNGVTIPNVNSNFWGGLNVGARCYYNNDSAMYSNTYGALYNWHAINTNNLCPVGWHVPTDVEWTVLVNYLGGDSVAGGKLKETGLSHWNSPNNGATNESGFTALPSGYNFDGGTFSNIGNYGQWWSYTEYDSTLAWKRYLNFSSSNVYRSIGYKIDGFSVRCLRD